MIRNVFGMNIALFKIVYVILKSYILSLYKCKNKCYFYQFDFHYFFVFVKYVCSLSCAYFFLVLFSIAAKVDKTSQISEGLQRKKSEGVESVILKCRKFHLKH